MFLANVTGDRRIPLIGVDQVIAEDRKFINISLSEPQRVQAVLIANQRGGDGEPIILDVSPSTFVDVAQNPNLKNIMLILEEFPDDIPPRILKCSIDYNVGNLFIFTNEIIDVTPSALLNLSFELGFTFFLYKFNGSAIHRPQRRFREDSRHFCKNFG